MYTLVDGCIKWLTVKLLLSFFHTYNSKTKILKFNHKTISYFHCMVLQSVKLYALFDSCTGIFLDIHIYQGITSVGSEFEEYLAFIKDNIPQLGSKSKTHFCVHIVCKI